MDTHKNTPKGHIPNSQYNIFLRRRWDPVTKENCSFICNVWFFSTIRLNKQTSFVIKNKVLSNVKMGMENKQSASHSWGMENKQLQSVTPGEWRTSSQSVTPAAAHHSHQDTHFLLYKDIHNSRSELRIGHHGHPRMWPVQSGWTQWMTQTFTHLLSMRWYDTNQGERRSKFITHDKYKRVHENTQNTQLSEGNQMDSGWTMG